MRKKNLLLLVVVTVVLSVIPVFAAPKFELDSRYTWDADMINSDIVNDGGYTGAGVYVAVLDTGLAPYWKDYFPQDRIATKLGRGFYEPVHYDPKSDELVGAGFVVETGWVGSTYSTHGTHVASTIIGYNYYSPSDEASGYELPPLFIEGIAPGATIIPVKVLRNYNLGKLGKAVFGTDLAVAAGIDYVRELKEENPDWPIIISMSLGAPEPSPVEKAAIDAAIEAGVIIVAASGNDGVEGMDWPGAYPEVISVGACGWEYEWYNPGDLPYYRLWWLQDSTYGYNDIPDPTPSDDVYVTEFSGRENQARAAPYVAWSGPQELDVLAPGSWVRGPFPGYPGYNRLPWWSEGKPRGWPVGMGNNFYYVGGTSMATPHVSAVAAMMLEKNPSLSQSEIESILESSALSLPWNTGMWIFDLYNSDGDFDPNFYLYTWDEFEATGYGVVQADSAVSSVTTP